MDLEMIWRKCPWCRKSVGLKGTLVLHDGWWIEDQLHTAGHVRWLEVPYHLSHCGGECAPRDRRGHLVDESGYHIELRRITGMEIRHEGDMTVQDWILHLRKKNWYRPQFDEGLRLTWALIASGGPLDKRRIKERGRMSKQLRAEIMERDHFRCRRCGTGPEVTALVVDHVVPVSKGGQSDRENLQTLCVPCNAGKGGRDPHPAECRPSGYASEMQATEEK